MTPYFKRFGLFLALLCTATAGCAFSSPAPSPSVSEATPTQTAGPLYVAADAVPLRAAPSDEAERVLLLARGLPVACLDTQGDWRQVRAGDTTGYIQSGLLSDTKPADLPSVLGAPNIIIQKSKRLLELRDGDALFAVYPIGLGRAPVGDKAQEGDSKTPEGAYYICTRNSNSKFYLSLGLSYPNAKDAEQGLAQGRITQSEYDQITAALRQKKQPPWNTALGGEIMIHGGGSASDWTAGCIALDNDAMDVLWAYCPLQTPVVIVP